jgi:AraC family cel operon transcriptional repressor
MESLTRENYKRFALELFLLQLLSSTHPDWRETLSPTAPTWLFDLTDKIKDPEQFRSGPVIIAKLAKRSPAYVARATKKYFGKTPTEMLNEARLDWAAKQLSLGDESVLEISLDCGFESLAYFYKIFEHRFGSSPKKYRLMSRRMLGIEL